MFYTTIDSRLHDTNFFPSAFNLICKVSRMLGRVRYGLRGKNIKKGLETCMRGTLMISAPYQNFTLLYSNIYVVSYIHVCARIADGSFTTLCRLGEAYISVKWLVPNIKISHSIPAFNYGFRAVKMFWLLFLLSYFYFRLLNALANASAIVSSSSALIYFTCL